MVCFLLISYVVLSRVSTPYGERLFLYAYPCVSFLLMKNTGIRNAPPAGTRSWRGDIRDVQIISAARLSDILPGSYLLSEQSPGSSQYPRGRTCPSRADLFIIKENPLDVKRIFSVFDEIFQKILEVIPLIFQSFSPGHVSGENTSTQPPWAATPVKNASLVRGILKGKPAPP